MNSLNSEIDCFFASSRGFIFSAREALIAGNYGKLESILEDVKSSQLVRNITSSISTAGERIQILEEKLERLALGGELIVGLTTVAAGAILFKSSAGLLTVISVMLIVLGILIAFPAVGEMVSRRMQDWWGQIEF